VARLRTIGSIGDIRGLLMVSLGPVLLIAGGVAVAVYAFAPQLATVFIHGKVADKYESGGGGWIIWEATVLHEMVHWARFQEKLPAGPHGRNDLGQRFEYDAYGEYIELTTPWRRGP
jgi:hypothetical protein